MKKIIPLLIIISLIILKCKEDEPTAPEEEIPAVTAIAEATIGPEGGILETEDFKLTIPPNSFLTASDLKLYAEPEEDTFGEFSVSNLFRISGIPDNFNEPLQVSLKYKGNLSGVNFIAIGRRDLITQIDTSFESIVYNLLDAQDSEGFLSAEVITDVFNENKLNKGNADPNELYYRALTKGFIKISDNFLFKGILPEGENEDRDKIIYYFEEAYTRFEAAGFDFTKFKWPFEVNFLTFGKSTPQSRTVCFTKAILYKDEIIISNKLRGEINQEFIKQVLLSYNNKDHLELNAIGYWASFKFEFDKSLIQPNIEQLLNNETFTDFTKALLIDFIVKDEKLVAQICRKNIGFFLALAELLGTPKQNAWLNSFYEQIMTDDKCDDLSNLFYIDNCGVKETINSDFNAKTYTHDYRKQSAKWYHLEFTSELNENSKLKFNTSSAKTGIVVIKFSTGAAKKREVVASGYGDVIITEVNDLIKNGYDLFVLVINNELEPEEGQNTITFKVEKNDDIVINSCSIFLRYLRGDFERIYSNGTKESLPNESLGAGFPRDDPTVQATFSNNTITQQYTNYQPNEDQSYTEKIVIVLADENNDGEYDYVSSFSADWEYTYKSSTTYKNNLSAITIPRDNSVPYLKFKLTGTDVCSKIQSLSTSEIRSSFTYSFVEGTHKCDSDSEIEIYISAE